MDDETLRGATGFFKSRPSHRLIRSGRGAEHTDATQRVKPGHLRATFQARASTLW